MELVSAHPVTFHDDLLNGLLIQFLQLEYLLKEPSNVYDSFKIGPGISPTGDDPEHILPRFIHKERKRLMASSHRGLEKHVLNILNHHNNLCWFAVEAFLRSLIVTALLTLNPV